MKWLAALLFVLPIYVPIVARDVVYFWIDPVPICPCAAAVTPQCPCNGIAEG